MNKYIFITILFLILSANYVSAQDNSALANKKHLFYFYWGYNRGYFSKSNLHFTSEKYDFTLYNVKASDRPSKFGKDYFTPAGFAIPQYNYRIGYFITDHLSISGGLDHMKYVMQRDQEVKMSGVISKEASIKYGGDYLNKTVKVEPDFLTFEHTNGFNLVTLDFEYLFYLKSLFQNNVSVFWNAGIGGVWVVTKTDVRVMGDGLDNDFHIAGWTLSAKTGPRIEYKHKIFLLTEIRTGYASLPSVLIKNSEPKVGDHNLLYLEHYIAIGMNFRLKKESKSKS